MSDSEELARKRRRRLIERLNETERLLGVPHSSRRTQMTEEELEAEIEKQRVLNAARRGHATGI